MSGQRIFAVGDIHGCYAKFNQMMGRLDWSPQNGDLLLFLGDYIDRGPQSFEVVESLIELKDKWPAQVITLLGNHEQMFLDFVGGLAIPDLFANGLAATVRDYCRPDHELSAAHLTFMRGLLHYYESDDYIFVHAGLAPGVSLAEQSLQDLLWIREPFLNSDYDFGKTVVFGHTPFKKPHQAPGRLGLDTGAVFGGPLSAVLLPEMRFVFSD